jgi:methyltransferase
LNGALLLLLLVTLQRGGELAISRRNTRRLRAQGAMEAGAGHYPWIVLLHGAWLVSLVPVALADPPLDWRYLVPFLLLQPLRLWILSSLGPRWTTRILVLPEAPLVRCGPYRYLRHPNYLVVMLEIPLLPLAMAAPLHALVFGPLNLGLLAWRIAVEERALAAARG